LVVNPFQELPIYDDAHIQRYKGKSIGAEPPHIFAISDAAFRNMKNSKKSQSIIVSGIIYHLELKMGRRGKRRERIGKRD